MKLAICMESVGYLESFIEYLDTKENCPFVLLGFTDVSKLIEACKSDREIKLIVIAEERYSADLDKLKVRKIILGEGRGELPKGVTRVSRIQPVGYIYKNIMEICMEEDCLPAYPSAGKEARVIGFYSPIKRAMQTSFARALGRSLSTAYKVLYVGLEPYDGYGSFWHGWVKDVFDLICHLEDDGDKFAYRVGIVEHSKEGLFYIPTPSNGQNLIYVTVREWLLLIRKLKEMGKYDFILLDLSDAIQGVYEILRQCEIIFTVKVPGKMAMNKMQQYEFMLHFSNYDDVLDKTVSTQVPEIKTITDDGEYWTLNDWRDYIREAEEWHLGVRL